jgi:hypothetical protein
MTMRKFIFAAAAMLAASSAFAAPHLNANQRNFGCSIVSGMVMCPSPGTGMAWKKGHNPLLGEPAEAYSVPNPCDFGCTSETIAAWDRAPAPKPRKTSASRCPAEFIPSDSSGYIGLKRRTQPTSATSWKPRASKENPELAQPAIGP